MGDGEPESLNDLKNKDNNTYFLIDLGNGPQRVSIPTLWTDNNDTLSKTDAKRLFSALSDLDITDPTACETVLGIRQALEGDWVDPPLGPHLNHEISYQEMRLLIIINPSVEEIQQFMGEDFSREQAENVRNAIETIARNYNSYYMNGNNPLWTLPERDVYFRTDAGSLSLEEVQGLVRAGLAENKEDVEAAITQANQNNPQPMAETISAELSKEELQELISLREKGLSKEDIAELFTVSGGCKDMESAERDATAIIQALDYMIDPTKFPDAKPLSSSQSDVRQEALAAVRNTTGMIGASCEASHEDKAPNGLAPSNGTALSI